MTQPLQSIERPHGPEVVLFCGGRDCLWTHHGELIRADIAGLRDGSVVLHGGQRGADMMADHFARERGLHAAKVDALWDFYGRSAGPRRNSAMMLLRPTFAFCYPTGGPGTAGMIGLLVRAGVEHVIRDHVEIPV